MQEQPIDFMFVRSNGVYTRICFSDIRFICAIRGYCKIKMIDTELLVREALKNFIAVLPPEKFVRVHKSHIVNLEKVSSFTATMIRIDNDRIPVGHGEWKESLLQHASIMGVARSPATLVHMPKEQLN